MAAVMGLMRPTYCLDCRLEGRGMLLQLLCNMSFCSSVRGLYLFRKVILSARNVSWEDCKFALMAKLSCHVLFVMTAGQYRCCWPGLDRRMLKHTHSHIRQQACMLKGMQTCLSPAEPAGPAELRGVTHDIVHRRCTSSRACCAAIIQHCLSPGKQAQCQPTMPAKKHTQSAYSTPHPLTPPCRHSTDSNGCTTCTHTHTQHYTSTCQLTNHLLVLDCATVAGHCKCSTSLRCTCNACTSDTTQPTGSPATKFQYTTCGLDMWTTHRHSRMCAAYDTQCI
jgi:hypothetical protein